MFSTILELIIEPIIEFIFGTLFFKIFRGIKLTGVFLVKIITFNRKSIKVIETQYDSSSLPYFLGFGFYISLGLLIF